MDKLLKISIMGAIAVVAFSVFYYFVIFLPGEQKAFRDQQLLIEREKQIQQLKVEADNKAQQEIAEIRKNEQQRVTRSLLFACIEDAGEAYGKEWTRNCKAKGLPDKCSLNKNVADAVDKHHEEMKEECFKLYPINKS
jgi:mannitol-specific phosphotransferase system IIBC component